MDCMSQLSIIKCLLYFGRILTKAFLLVLAKFLFACQWPRRNHGLKQNRKGKYILEQQSCVVSGNFKSLKYILLGTKKLWDGIMLSREIHWNHRDNISAGLVQFDLYKFRPIYWLLRAYLFREISAKNDTQCISATMSQNFRLAIIWTIRVNFRNKLSRFCYSGVIQCQF